MNKIFSIIDFKKVNQAVPPSIKKLAQAREVARQAANWEKADELRQEMEKHGWAIEDSPEGPAFKKL